MTSVAAAQSPCPDSAQLSRAIGQEIAAIHAAWRASRRPAPAACWYTRIAQGTYSDSVVDKTLELSEAALQREPENPEILYARLVLLSRARRFSEVIPTMDALFVARPVATTEETHRLTVAAAMQLHDTSAITNRLANAAMRFPRSQTLAPEYEVWRQMPRLRALIDTVHRIMRKDPTLTAGLVNLSSIYGSLDQPDSAMVYAKRALRAGVSREAVARGLESLIGVRMRRAKILDTPELWTATLPIARRIDSTLSTPASKYLVALSLAGIVKSEAQLAIHIASGIDSGEPDGYGRQTRSATGESYLRVMSCPRLAELESMIAAAKANLDAGGDQFAPETVPALRGGLQRMAGTFALLKPRCTS